MMCEEKAFCHHGLLVRLTLNTLQVVEAKAQVVPLARMSTAKEEAMWGHLLPT